MRKYQAEKILKFGGIPRTREEQEALIRTRGYTSLRNSPNSKPLYQCSDNQIYAVACKLYEEAERVKEIRPTSWSGRLAKIAERDQAEFLYDIFNIPSEQREYVCPSELEARLLE